MNKKEEKQGPYLNYIFRNDLTGAAPVPAPIVTDPNGSYTGRPKDPLEKPIQDADDL